MDCYERIMVPQLKQNNTTMANTLCENASIKTADRWAYSSENASAEGCSRAPA